jgi:hypothetical protein
MRGRATAGSVTGDHADRVTISADVTAIRMFAPLGSDELRVHATLHRDGFEMAYPETPSCSSPRCGYWLKASSVTVTSEWPVKLSATGESTTTVVFPAS